MCALGGVLVHAFVASAASTPISAVTYNVKGNGVSDFSTSTAQVQAMGRQVSYLQPDVIAFNEIPNSQTYQMASFVAAFLPGYYLATNSATDGYIRSVILSRHPITRSQSWLYHASLTNFGYDGVFTRDLFEAEISVPGFSQPLHVFAAHLKALTDAASSARRAAEASAVSNFFVTSFLTTNAQRPYLLMGDMNEDVNQPPSNSQQPIPRLANTGTDLRLTTPVNSATGDERTWSIRSLPLTTRFDYIFPCGLLFSNIVSSEVFRTDLLTPLPPGLNADDDGTASDHLPVRMVFNNPYQGSGDPPQITAQPQSQTVVVGANATFAVAATGNAPLSYQWRFNGTNLAGATASSYRRANILTNDAGSYSVVITNVAGSLTSSNALLTVQPLVPGTPGIIAQWNFNDTNVVSSPAPSVGAGTAALLGATATFARGSTADTNASNYGWNTAEYPAQGTGNKTRGVQFNVSTAGKENIAIAWENRLSNTASKYVRLLYSTNGTDFLDLNVVTGTTTFGPISNNLSTVNGVRDNPNFAFRIVTEFESTATGTANANYATASASSYATAGTIRFDMMTVLGTTVTNPGPETPPVITQQPQSQIVLTHSTVTLDVGVSGTAPFSYQWQFDGTNLPGATAALLTLNEATAKQAGDYCVRVSNVAGVANSSTAVLSVYDTAAAALSSSSLAPEGQLLIQVTGIPGYHYAVQVSTNMTDWESILTNTSPFTFTATNNEVDERRLFRTLCLP